MNRPGALRSRRSFLRSSAALSLAATAFPACLPTGLLAAPARPGPNDRIGIGFIGMGRQAGDLLAVLKGLKDARVVAVADVNYPRALQATKPLGAAAYQHYRRLLERKDVDAIITATPEQWRSLICLESCQAGKDLYVEKPMSLTIREGRLMVEAVRQHGRVFQTGSQQRSMWPNHLGCELVRTGRLGRIRRVIAYNYPSPWEGQLPARPAPPGIDWDFWCGPTDPVPFNPDLYAPRAQPGWLSFRPYSGGEMTGWGAHGLDQVQWALGMDTAGPIEVWTEGPPFRPPIYRQPEPKTRGDALCSQPKVFFRYPGDVVVELGDGPMGGAVFVGDTGRITIDRASCKSDPPELAEDALEKRPAGFQPNHLQNWLDCIKSRKRPVAEAETGHRSATVCHLGNIARWTGRRLRWDPVQETFPEDADARKYLDRPRRKGYELPRVL